MSKSGYARLAKEPKDYENLGIVPRDIALWEDGLRSKVSPGNFEWWYFDAHLEDGTAVVISFFTKPIAQPDLPLTPHVTISITDPDGRSIDKTLTVPVEDFSASKESCDVRIGDNRFVGDLNTYRITATIEEVSVDVELTGEVPSWRPRTGHTYYGCDGERDKFFAWLPSVPQGKVKIKYSVAGKTTEATGIGYHDHNWGDAPMPSLIQDWYWARAKIGPYTVIASYATAAKKYGYTPYTVFLLAKDGEVVADDEAKVVFGTQDNVSDAVLGAPVANISTYTYSDEDTEYVVTFKREATILRLQFRDELSLFKRLLAKLLFINPGYMRFKGSAKVEKRINGEIVESHEEPAIWEQMYFGRPRPPAV